MPGKNRHEWKNAIGCEKMRKDNLNLAPLSPHLIQDSRSKKRLHLRNCYSRDNKIIAYYSNFKTF